MKKEDKIKKSYYFRSYKSSYSYFIFKYIVTTLTGLMKITSFIENFSTLNGKYYLRCHINIYDKNMNVLGGHLNEYYNLLQGNLLFLQ